MFARSASANQMSSAAQQQQQQVFQQFQSKAPVSNVRSPGAPNDVLNAFDPLGPGDR